ncbi:MAG: hypothetical protein HOP15_17575 [Planctomycetes bacterium]|nr:hypothetical protein [Planctomycetota bacterium]
MLFVHSRLGSLHPWIPAAAALALIGCGGSEEAKGPETSRAAPPSELASAAKPASSSPGIMVEVPSSGSFSPLTVPVEDVLENEPGVEKPLVASFPEGRPADPPPAIDDLPDEDELLGKPLVINGRVIPFEEIKRQCCLGRYGVAEIETAKIWIFIDEEIKRRVAAGASAEEFVVKDEEVHGMVKAIEEQIKAEYPQGDMTLEDVFANMATEAPLQRLRVQRLFEKLFLPEDPAQYPPVTIAAILSGPSGDVMLAQVQETYAEAKQTGIEMPRNSDLDDAFMQQIVAHLHSTATIEAAPALGVLYRVNGVDITVADIWERIKSLVTVMEVRAAKQWIVNTTLLKEALAAANVWLTDEEAEAAYHAHSDPYKDSIFSYERLAVTLKQFPSIERYKEYRRIYDSFHRMKKPEITAETLERHGELRTNKIIGQVSVDVDVILCSAFDIKAGRWKSNGWVEAENRMRDLLDQIVEEQRPWEEMVEKYSEFYEPPASVSARQEGLSERPVKGRFRNYQRNNLLNELGESEYELFLNGTSITDFIFLEQEVGTLGTPMRGPLGWYLPRLTRRSKPPRQLAAKEETLAILRLDDYLIQNLNSFAQELIRKNEVFGLELPGTTPK